ADEHEEYLNQAKRTARAAESKWIRPEDGAIRDEANFAHMLIDAYLELHEIDPDRRWLEDAGRAATFVHDHCRDANGHYPKYWEARPHEHKSARLIDQAAAARAFWRLAKYDRRP